MTDLHDYADRFLGSRHGRDFLAHPHIIDGLRVCTDGYAMICIPSDAESAGESESVAKVVRWLVSAVRAAELTEPDIPVDGIIDACWHCGGTKRITSCECDECEGTGQVEISTYRHDYAADYKECDGSGLIPCDSDRWCDECCGTGISAPTTDPVIVAGIPIQKKGYPDLAVERR